MTILTIVTGLPPSVDGVGDYALNLAKQLRQDFNVETHFVVGNPAWVGASSLEGFDVEHIESRSRKALLSLLLKANVSTLFLHYVGYGYAKRGCPIWLLDGLTYWQKSSKNRHVVTMFHELYAFGSPWTSAFWLSPLQRHLAARLSNLSDAIVTSQQSYATLLCKLSNGRHCHFPVLPIFSSVGEPKVIPPLSSRARRMVVFGGKNKRIHVYQKYYQELANASHALGIEEIIDLGPAIDLQIKDVAGIPIVRLGLRSASEVSKILADSMSGFMSDHPGFLAKSSIFAAYCAHGLLPVVPVDSYVNTDDLVLGRHYIASSRIRSNEKFEELEAIAGNAFDWYKNHNLSVQGKIFADLLTSAK